MLKVKKEGPTDVIPTSALCGDKDAQQDFLYVRVLQCLAVGMEHLGLPFAVTGRAVGFEIGVKKPPPIILIALLDHGGSQSTSPKSVEERLADLVYDSDRPGHQWHAFRVDRPGQVIFGEPRLPFLKTEYKIAFVNVSSLSPAAQIRYTHLAKSKHGWSMTAPLFYLLDYLLLASESIRDSLQSGNPMDILYPEASHRAQMLQEMVLKQAPGTCGDYRFLEKEHIEAAMEVAPFVPQIRSFLAFEQIFLEHDHQKGEVKDEQPVECTGRSVSPDTDRYLSSSPTPPLEWVPVTKLTMKTRRLNSAQWVAERILATLHFKPGLSIAFSGDMVNMMYTNDTRSPKKVDVVVYDFNADHSIDAVVVKQVLVSEDPTCFKLVPGRRKSPSHPRPEVLYCKPPQEMEEEMDCRFIWQGKGLKIGVRVQYSSRNGIPASIDEIEWRQGLPIVPFASALIDLLAIWYNTSHINPKGSPQQQRANELLVLLRQDTLMESLSITPPWCRRRRADRLSDKSRNHLRRMVAAFVKSRVGKNSKKKWEDLGLF